MTESISEIEWNQKPYLKPGQDYHDGITYFTVPLLRNVMVPGKKKDDPPKLAKKMSTFIVTSKREGIWYDTAALDPHGFIPIENPLQENESRWTRPSVRAFLENDISGPDSKSLFGELRTLYTKYVEFTDESYYDIMSLYVMYTYAFRLFESTGYIHFNGTMASGKSRNLSILNALAFNTIWASSMSAAALYRKLAGSPGTTCIDESEGFEGERGEELRRILNAGYREGSRVTRAEKGADDKFTTVMFDVFGPKALASINPLDSVIASRCIIVSMRPAVRQLPDFLQSDPEWSVLRDKLYLWALANTATIDAVAKSWRTGNKKDNLAPKLIGRQWETTEQFIVLADFIGGESFATRIIDFFNIYFQKQQEAADATDRLRTTLRCLPRVLATKQPHPGSLYSVKDIHEVIASYMEVDSTEYFKTKHVTKNLDVLGFKKKVRSQGGLRIKLVEAEVRNEFKQRRVEPFEEDIPWLAGTTTYQTPTTLFDTYPEPVEKAETTPWWDTEEDLPDMEELTGESRWASGSQHSPSSDSSS